MAPWFEFDVRDYWPSGDHCIRIYSWNAFVTEKNADGEANIEGKSSYQELVLLISSTVELHV